MRILVAEDDPVSRRLLQSVLSKWGYEVVICCDGQEAWEALQKEDAPQLIILDWMMPKMDGLQVCHQVRKAKSEWYVYIVLLTAKSQREDLLMGMEAGADDYLTKPFDPQELKVKLRAGRRILDLQSELIAARDALRVQATRDPLTGLWNRGAILDVLKRELSRADREGNSIGVVMGDIDHFKSINDTHGHQAGDTVLREVASRMRAALRPYDEVGRYGGEEFLMILPGCDISRAAIVAERLRTNIGAEDVLLEEGRLSVTCSLGVASNFGVPEAGVDWLIRVADEALYRAKKAGRNCVGSALAREKDGATTGDWRNR